MRGGERCYNTVASLGAPAPSARKTQERKKHHEAERLAGIAEDRKSQVGTGDRSERIRTYNYPQGRVTDHRIGLTLYKLDSFMNGDIEEVINALITADQAEKMKAMGNTDSI